MQWYAHQRARAGRTTYWHISPNEWWVRLNDATQPIVEVNVVEVPESDATETDYWGWLRAGKDVPTMIFPSINLLRICFPYDVSVDVDKGKGRVVRLRITPAAPDALPAAPTNPPT